MPWRQANRPSSQLCSPLPPSRLTPPVPSLPPSSLSPHTQERNYIARKEAERARRELFDDALSKFKKGKIEDVSERRKGPRAGLGAAGRAGWRVPTPAHARSRGASPQPSLTPPSLAPTPRGATHHPPPRQDMIPTVGFNMRKVTKGGVVIKLWDLGGQVGAAAAAARLRSTGCCPLPPRPPHRCAARAPPPARTPAPADAVPVDVGAVLPGCAGHCVCGGLC